MERSKVVLVLLLVLDGCAALDYLGFEDEEENEEEDEAKKEALESSWPPRSKRPTCQRPTCQRPTVS